MIKIDVELKNGGHIIVGHEISDINVFANELVHGIDLIISELVPFEKGLTLEENMDRVLKFRNTLFEKIRTKEYTCSECYVEEE